MIYREYLVMRNALVWYAGIVLAIMLLNLILLHKGDGVDYASIAVQSGSFAALFAWIFGVALGNGSREAARVLWVLPAERWKLALQVIAIDLAGITVAFACEFAAMLLLLTLGSLRFTVQIHGTLSVASIVLALALAYAAYGWSALVGMLGRRVPYCGIISAPALIIWMTVAQSPATIGAILRAPIVANPIAVFNTVMALGALRSHHSTLDAVSSSLQWLGTGWETPVLVAITVATCGAAIALWQRADLIY